MSGILIALAVLAAGVAGIIVPLVRRRRALAELEARESLDPDAFYERFYAASKLPKAEVLQLLCEVADTLNIPRTKLRPGDRFGKEIGTYWITSGQLDLLEAKGRERARALGLSVDFETLRTLDHYIRCFAVRTAVHQAAPASPKDPRD
jgi:hypothetical protein